MSPLSERTTSLASRIPDPEKHRDPQAVSLLLVDGTQIQGVLHRAPGTRTLDFLNRQSEGFVAMTDVLLSLDGRTETVGFIAINKVHIVRLVEAIE